jgi:hypothetical protein
MELDRIIIRCINTIQAGTNLLVYSSPKLESTTNVTDTCHFSKERSNPLRSVRNLDVEKPLDDQRVT